MEVEVSPYQNSADNDNREKCEKRKREDDFTDPNERDVKKFCVEVQSMVISETPNAGITMPSISSNFNNTAQPNIPNFVSTNKFPSNNYPSPLPSHFFRSSN